jgi:hypothetical protein
MAGHSDKSGDSVEREDRVAENNSNTVRNALAKEGAK